MQDGRSEDWKAALPKWTDAQKRDGIWNPPGGTRQALQQGGMLVFHGAELAFSHADPATGAHADLGAVLAAATRGL